MSNVKFNIDLKQKHDIDAIIIKFRDKNLFIDKEHQYNQAIQQVLKWGFKSDPLYGVDNAFVIYNDEIEKNPNAIINRFKNNEFIEYVELNYLCESFTRPNDPRYNTNTRVAALLINVEKAWEINTDSDILIAIVDSGCNSHEDLPPIKGRNVTNNTNNVTDINGHGTAMAGVIGAIGNNGIGATGVLWNANMIHIKTMVDGESTFTHANISNAIRWAADNGARVISMSLGGPTGTTTMSSAVDYAYGKGCVLVASAGNILNAEYISFPGRYDKVIAVGGTTTGTTRYVDSWNSSHIGEGLDVMSSWFWYTTLHDGKYERVGGTSSSAAQVSALAAHILEMNPNLTNIQVMDLIRNNTNRGNNIWDRETGYGTIDIYKTLMAVETSCCRGCGSIHRKAGEGKKWCCNTGWSLVNVTNATCTEPRIVKEKHGSPCNKERNVIVGNPLGHLFGDWFETIYPTITTQGQERRNCTRTGCTHFEIKSVPRLWHVQFDIDGGIRTDGGELSQGVRDGHNAILPILSKEGYVLVGWDIPNGYLNIHSDINIKAIWAHKQACIFGTNITVPLIEDGDFFISKDIQIPDENEKYDFELVLYGLKTGIKIKRTPIKEPIMTIQQMKEKYSVEKFGHFYICHTGPNKISIVSTKNKMPRWVVQTEQKLWNTKY